MCISIYSPSQLKLHFSHTPTMNTRLLHSRVLIFIQEVSYTGMPLLYSLTRGQYLCRQKGKGLVLLHQQAYRKHNGRLSSLSPQSVLEAHWLALAVGCCCFIPTQVISEGVYFNSTYIVPTLTAGPTENCFLIAQLTSQPRYCPLYTTKFAFNIFTTFDVSIYPVTCKLFLQATKMQYVRHGC